MRAVARSLILGLALCWAGPVAFAQPLSFGQIEGPQIVILNQERLFRDSRFGQRVQRELEAASTALSQENRQIEAELLQEERDLTDQRATMSAEEFQPLADEFDERVEQIRATQSERVRDLNQLADRAQERFLRLITPILRDLLRERGASAVLDARVVLYAVEGADITDVALQRIDTVLGDGGEIPILDQLRADGEAEAEE